MDRKNCISWDKFKDKQGYGQISINRRTLRAHKYFYEQKFGKILEGKVIDHLCKNPSCINTDHMEIVTIAENTRRGKSAKLNYSLITKIRTIYKNMKITQIELGKMFGVGQSQISRIVNERRWA